MIRWLPILLSLVACASSSPLDTAGFGGTEVAAEVGADGVSTPLDLPDEPLVLLVDAGPGHCVSLADADGRPAPTVDPIEEHGLFLIDAGPVRLVHVDCVTRLRRAETLTLDARHLPRQSAPQGTITVRLLLSQHTTLPGDLAAQSALMAHLADELAEADITVSLHSVVELDGAPDDLTFGPGDLAALRAVVAIAPPTPHRVVDLVITSCLRYDDPYFGPPSPVDGFTPRVTGGASPLDAVFLPGRVCGSFSKTPRALDPARSAHVLAHELGHFLGLRHTVGPDGDDDLDDTGHANLMHPNPSLESSRGLSPAQARRMRSHPYVVPTAGPSQAR